MSSTLTELDIRSAIATALAGLLGTYTYSNGATEPAFKASDGSYQAPGHPWPHGPEIPKVTGLEAVLEVDVDDPNVTQLLARDYWVYARGRLTLKQHDITSTVRVAKDVVLKVLNDLLFTVEVGPRVSRDSRIDNIETQSLTFFYPQEN